MLHLSVFVTETACRKVFTPFGWMAPFRVCRQGGVDCTFQFFFEFLFDGGFKQGGWHPIQFFSFNAVWADGTF